MRLQEKLPSKVKLDNCNNGKIMLKRRKWQRKCKKAYKRIKNCKDRKKKKQKMKAL